MHGEDGLALSQGHRLAGLKSAIGGRGKVGAECRIADDPPTTADPGHQQQIAGLGSMAQCLGLTNADSARRLYAGELRQTLDAGGLGSQPRKVREDFAVAAYRRALAIGRGWCSLSRTGTARALSDAIAPPCSQAGARCVSPPLAPDKIGKQ